MTVIAFKIFYRFDGPTKDAPFREEKSAEEIVAALEGIEDALSMIIDDSMASISVTKFRQEQNSRLLVVKSTLSEADVIAAVEKTLQGLDIYGTKLDQIPPAEVK